MAIDGPRYDSEEEDNKNWMEGSHELRDEDAESFMNFINSTY